MAVSLSKGQKVSLTKDNPGLAKVQVGLGWDTNRYDGGSDFDLDSACFVLYDSDKVKEDADMVFYNNLTHSSGSITHLGDNRTGEGEGDDESIKIDLSAVPADVKKLAFTVTIHDAEARSQNFGQVSNAYIRIFDENNGSELLRYDLSEDFSIETAVVVGELYRNGDEWKFAAVGSGFSGGLGALCKGYGIEI